MVDIHCHVLPQMDDGSRCVEESLAILKTLAAQGVYCAAATPHFYASENNPREFLQRRAASAEQLEKAWRPGLPALKLGAEVCYYQGISQCEGLESLKIEDTQLLLLEMPLGPWTPRMLHEVWEIQNRPGVTVILAHIERYLRWQKEDTWETLTDWGVLNQCNASFFLNWRTRRKALKLLRGGKIHLLGSDSHNMETRPPHLGEAYHRLELRDRTILVANSHKFLPDWK